MMFAGFSFFQFHPKPRSVKPVLDAIADSKHSFMTSKLKTSELFTKTVNFPLNDQVPAGIVQTFLDKRPLPTRKYGSKK